LAQSAIWISRVSYKFSRKMQPISGAILCLLCSGLDGVRMAKKTEVKERVHTLVTFGAAKPSLKPLTNPATGDCFDGYRFVNQDTFAVDNVPALAATCSHPKIISIKIDSKSKVWEYDCHDYRQLAIKLPSLSLHKWETYVSRVRASNLSAETIAVATNGLAIAYLPDVEVVKSTLESGWELVGTTNDGEDHAHLIQNQQSECILTFEGSDDAADWYTNFAIWAVPFCNLKEKIHNGFRSELMRVVQQPGYLQTIKPKLSSCSKLTVMGHSLGGAVASIFAACANNEAAASDDENFTALKWW